MKSRLDRRTFLRLACASAALMAQEARPQTTPQATSQTKPQAGAQATPQAGRPAKCASRGGSAPRAGCRGGEQEELRRDPGARLSVWVDEGVDAVLDNIQQKGDVNTVWAYTFGYGETRLTRGDFLPDHVGKARHLRHRRRVL